MAELTQKERLQPSLLDRLTDDAPEKKQESREQRVLSISRLRECVLRDMGWLLNTGTLDAAQNLENYPHVVHSVLNFGIPDLAGRTLSGTDLVEIERRVKQAIWDFEPRILPDTLRVTVSTSEDQMNHNAMSFDIEGDLWAQPLPLRLYFKTELDLETGNMEILDKGG
ncbi:MAG: type VI secretion system baseplate subunit TssE [Methylomicrobium sp.]